MTTLDKYDPHANGLRITNWDAPIYRIFPIERLRELISTGRNCLVNPSKWDDPFENFLLQAKCVNSRGEPIGLDTLRADWYGQCWTLNRESDAMWRIYSPKKDGARIRTTIRKLFESFYDTSDDFARLRYFIGEVQYTKQSDIEQFLQKVTFQDLAFGGMPHKFAETLLVKRPEFDHEREVRLLYQDVDPKIGRTGLAFFNFDQTAIIDEIVLDPRLSSRSFARRRNQLVANGCKLPVVQSDLYHFTPATIRLS